MLGVLRRLLVLGMIAAMLTVGCASFARYSASVQAERAITDATAAMVVLDGALSSHIDALPDDLDDRTFDNAMQAVADLRQARVKLVEARALYMAEDDATAAGRTRAALFELEAVVLYLDAYPESRIAVAQARLAIERAYIAVNYVLESAEP